jgi:hypothetical protein
MSRKVISTSDPSLRLSATLLFIGILLSFLAGFFHPDHAYANDHIAVFAEYASSSDWTAVHLGQFAGMAVLIAGLVVLYFALDIQFGTAVWIGRFAVICAVVTLAMYAVLQAVDGVALKHAVDAWAAAPESEKAIRFASAETIRWLEWAVRSYQSYMLGLSLILFGAAVALTGQISKAIGLLMALSGLAYLAQGWIIASEGFSDANTFPTLLGIGSTLIWSVWLLLSSWRSKVHMETPGKQELASR